MLTLLHTLDKRLGVKDRSGSRMLTAVLQLRRPADATDLLLRRVARTAGLALEVSQAGERRDGQGAGRSPSGVEERRLGLWERSRRSGTL